MDLLWRGVQIRDRSVCIEAVFEMLGKQLGMEPGDVYLNIMEMERLGTRGHLK